MINNNRQVNSPLVVEIILQFDNLQGTSEEGVVVNGKVNIVVRDEFQHKVDAQLALLNFIEGTKLGKDVVFTDLQKIEYFWLGKIIQRMKNNQKTFNRVFPYLNV